MAKKIKTEKQKKDPKRSSDKKKNKQKKKGGSLWKKEELDKLKKVRETEEELGDLMNIVGDDEKEKGEKENKTKKKKENKEGKKEIEASAVSAELEGKTESKSRKSLDELLSSKRKEEEANVKEERVEKKEDEKQPAKGVKESQIKSALLDGDYVTEDDITAAEEYAKKSKSNFITYLIREELITKDILGQAVAESFDIRYADLNSKQPSKEQIMRIPDKVARRHRIVLFEDLPEKLVIATDTPIKRSLFSDLERVFGQKKIEIAYSLTEDVDSVLVHYRKALETRFAKIIEKEGGVAPEIIDEIFKDAMVFRSSDIHFEPQKYEVVIRFRVDGVLHEAGRIPREYYDNVLNRIKVQARLRTDEHFAAQDGSIRFEEEEQTVDMRVSIVPTLDGEKIVIRLLTSYINDLGLGNLGLSDENQVALTEGSRKPFGMILTVGPTGSGKTTTLYSVLRFLNRPEVNITTIEDPVEYKVIGANQIQVNPQTHLTFSKGLRSIVRQDPDIILVGEIRDEETAEIAVNAALTGHLLLSTFHANNAATTIPRLLDMNVEPFILASTLELIIAQRLVRKICEKCRRSYKVKSSELEEQFSQVKGIFSGESTFYKGSGCETCNHSGYKGRTAIFEFIKIDRNLKELILQNPSTQQIWDLAKKNGSQSLFEDGIEKVKKGITTIDELMRVAPPVK